eukprot:Phypoly_transcript_11743.p2 GENE.Phypoly_transcript_11743~~Phypoly_transcript_11743.p2  ORF type:complete len:158 (+),score=11.00 Phypoly_transcript_11743:164-637(+)
MNLASYRGALHKLVDIFTNHAKALSRHPHVKKEFLDSLWITATHTNVPLRELAPLKVHVKPIVGLQQTPVNVLLNLEESWSNNTPPPKIPRLPENATVMAYTVNKKELHLRSICPICSHLLRNQATLHGPVWNLPHAKLVPMICAKVACAQDWLWKL